MSRGQVGTGVTRHANRPGAIVPSPAWSVNSVCKILRDRDFLRRKPASLDRHELGKQTGSRSPLLCLCILSAAEPTLGRICEKVGLGPGPLVQPISPTLPRPAFFNPRGTTGCGDDTGRVGWSAGTSVEIATASDRVLRACGKTVIMAGIVKIICPNCPRELQIRPEHIGHRVECKFCGFSFRVPQHVLIPCPSCGQDGKVRTEHLGRRIRCKHCAQVSVARLTPTMAWPESRGAAEPEAARLRIELERKQAECAALTRQLAEARERLTSLDPRTRSLRDARDIHQHTMEWAVGCDDPEAVDEETERGTEPDLALARLPDEEPTTRTDLGELEDSEPTTLFPDGLPSTNQNLESLRAERDRLRAELDELRDHADQTIVTRDGLEVLERDLEASRADNVRLSEEREELSRAAERLIVLLRERDEAMAEAERDRDALRADRDRLEAELRDRAAEAERDVRSLQDRRSDAVRDHPGPAQAPSDVEAVRALREEVEFLRRDRDATLGRLAAAEARGAELSYQLAETEAERDETERLVWIEAGRRSDADREPLVRQLAAVTADRDELAGRAARAEAERDDFVGRAAQAEAERDELKNRFDQAVAERDHLKSRVDRAEADLARRIEMDEVDRTSFHLPDAEAIARAVAEAVDAARAETEVRIAVLADRARNAADLAERATTERDAARSKVEQLTRELASARDELELIAPVGSLSPSAIQRADRERIEQLILERDQARRDVARLRSILDHSESKDMAGG